MASVLVKPVGGVELPRELYRPWLRQYDGILNGHLVFDRVRACTRKSFDDVKTFRRHRQVWGTGHAGVGLRGLAVKILCLDDQRIAFPMSPRFTQVFLDRRIDKRAAIGWNDPGFVSHLQEDDDVTWRLHETNADVVVARQHRYRHAAGDASIPRIEVVDRIENRLSVGCSR